MFRGEGCGYCAKALEWFDSIKETEGKYFNLVTYEVWNDESNKAIMDKVANFLGDDVSGVPYIIVGDKSFQGFDESYKEGILNKIHEEYNKNEEDRFDVINKIESGADKKKDNIISYFIVILVVALIIFVVVARYKSGNEESLNFEYDDKDDDYDDVKREEKKEEVVVEKKETKKTPAKKTTTSKETKGTSAKKTATKTSTSKRGRPAKKK